MSAIKAGRVVLSLGVFAAAAPVLGDVIVSNLAEPFRATTDIGNNPNPVPPPSKALEWSWAAQSFTVDATSYTLTRIDIIGGLAASDPVIIAELRADNAGVIGPLIATFTVPDFTGAPAPRALVPDMPVTLDASATYWIVLGSQSPGDGTLGWSYANTNDSVGVGVISAYADSQDSGANWNYGTVFPYFIQVVADKRTPCTGCPGDANGDGEVNFADITQVLTSWGLPCK
jgi:hypothetical protein